MAGRKTVVRQSCVRSLLVSSLPDSSVVMLSLSDPPLFEWETHMYGRAPLNHWPVLLVLAVNTLFFFIGQAPAGWLRLRKGMVE